MRKQLYHPFVALLWLCGNLAPLYLVWLLWPRFVPARAPSPDLAKALSADLLLALIFPLQHSLWTQTPVKRALKDWLGERLERPLYVLASGVALVVVCAGWQCTDRVVWTAPAWTLWPLRALMIVAFVAQGASASVVGMKFLLGLTHVKALAEAAPLRQPEFRERGLYRFIRHPIAASQLVIIWIAATMFADRLLLAVVWTLWIVAATWLEDNRLAAEFGETYAAYRRRAGFLWPKFA